MSYNGAGVFQLAAGNPVVTGTTISSTWANNTLSDIANNGLSNCITKDGQQTVTANIPFNNNRLVTVGNGVAASDAATVGQIQSGSAVTLTGLSGTGDAITANSAPAITAYAVGQSFIYIPTSTNTVYNPTINISTVGAKTITQSNGNGLWSGALAVGTPYEITYDGTNFRVMSGTLGNQILQMSYSPSFRNRITDGNFRFWDFGVSFAVSTAQIYTATMWLAQSGTGGAATVSQQSYVTGGEPISMTSPVINYLRWQQTTNATSNPVLSHKVEHVQTFQGRSATLSMWLWTSSGTLTIPTIGFNQAFGSGGSAAVLSSVAVNWNITTTPTFFSVRLDWPNISGKTIGTGDYISINLLLPTGSTFTINTTQWQVEDCPSGAPASGLPTPFEFSGDALETGRVRRYAQSMQLNMRQYAASAGAVSNTTVSWSTPMRVAPAVSIFSAGTATNLNSQTLVPSTPTNGLYQIVATSAGDCSALTYVYTIDARL